MIPPRGVPTSVAVPDLGPIFDVALQGLEDVRRELTVVALDRLRRRKVRPLGYSVQGARSNRELVTLPSAVRRRGRKPGCLSVLDDSLPNRGRQAGHVTG